MIKVPLAITTNIPTINDHVSLEIKAGSSIVFVGANGSGKTRLGVLLDATLSARGAQVHRIAAHRSLTLDPAVIPPNLEIAKKRLFYGFDRGDHNHKHGHRFSSSPETAMLSDFDHLLSALYAENTDVSIAFRQVSVASPGSQRDAPSAKIDRLVEIWQKVLPHRELIVLGGNIRTRAANEEYSAADMSDGERVIFYLIGQALLAMPDTLLIFDEPELHINKSIISKLWDEIESARTDCCFLYITHDIEFAVSRHAATKYALRSYRKEPSEAWELELVPEDSDLPDDVVAMVLGSRRPILFVEGGGASLDSSLYRRVYDQLTVIPVGSCDQVIHSVISFSAHSRLHHVGCAGLVDADGRTDEETTYLASRKIYRLPVSEVENLLLLPNVLKAIAAALMFQDTVANQKIDAIKTYVFGQAQAQIDSMCLRYTARQVDAKMKKVGLTGDDIMKLDANFRSAAATIDPKEIYDAAKSKIQSFIESQNYEQILLHYDNKGLLSEVARQFGMNQRAFEEFVGRALRSNSSATVRDALRAYLPVLPPQP